MWILDYEWIIKIVLSGILGGLIGYERESVQRPAGLRTHILVAIGATLVSAINTELISDLGGIDGVSIAPARYGAAVISGIGFLGAGTIIKEGSSVKGLTTAAGLWTVACIGLVVGHGYYLVATAASVFVFLTLEVIMQYQDRFGSRRKSIKLKLLVHDNPGVVGKIGDVVDSLNLKILSMSTKSTSTSNETLITIRLKYNKRTKPTDVFEALKTVKDIISIEHD